MKIYVQYCVYFVKDGEDEIDENDFCLDDLLADASESDASSTTNSDVSYGSSGASNEINEAEALNELDRLDELAEQIEETTLAESQTSSSTLKDKAPKMIKVIDDNDSENDVDGDLEPVVVPKPTKKRGRPPKNKTGDVAEEIDIMIREIENKSKSSETANASPRLTRSRAKASSNSNSLMVAKSKGIKRNRDN